MLALEFLVTGGAIGELGQRLVARLIAGGGLLGGFEQRGGALLPCLGIAHGRLVLCERGEQLDELLLLVVAGHARCDLLAQVDLHRLGHDLRYGVFWHVTGAVLTQQKCHAQGCNHSSKQILHTEPHLLLKFPRSVAEARTCILSRHARERPPLSLGKAEPFLTVPAAADKQKTSGTEKRTIPCVDWQPRRFIQ